MFPPPCESHYGAVQDGAHACVHTDGPTPFPAPWKSVSSCQAGAGPAGGNANQAAGGSTFFNQDSCPRSPSPASIRYLLFHSGWWLLCGYGTARAVAWWSRGREGWSGEASWLVQAPPWSSGWGIGQSGADAAGGGGGVPSEGEYGEGVQGRGNGGLGRKREDRERIEEDGARVGWERKWRNGESKTERETREPRRERRKKETGGGQVEDEMRE